MDSSHLVDPELRPVLSLFPSVTLSVEALPAMRSRLLPIPPYEGPEIRSEVVDVLGLRGAPKVALYVHRPAAAKRPMPCIYHMHGGGYVAGSAASMTPLHQQLANELHCAIVSVEYRVAPETAFPGAIEDCYAGLSWTYSNARDLGIDAAWIGVMGESAGGGLAAALALMARDRGEVPLAFQHLIYPMIDDRTCTLSNPHPFAGEFIWPAHNNRFGWTALLGHEPGRADVSPYAAAARASDVSRLPPTFIGTGALDLFLEENLEYARRLTRAGVPVELHVYPGAFHAFNLMPGARTAEAARRDSREALRRALHG
jgi:triacylglycerol lipase